MRLMPIVTSRYLILFAYSLIVSLTLDGILQAQATSDCRYFCSVFAPALSVSQVEEIRMKLLQAYRWQYIRSGAQNRHFVKVLHELLSDEDLRAKVSTAIDSLS